MLAARSKETIDRVAESLRSSNTASKISAIQADVSSSSQVDTLFEQVISTFGRIDIVVHCAGVLGPLEKLGDAPVDAWSTAFVCASHILFPVLVDS